MGVVPNLGGKGGCLGGKGGGGGEVSRRGLSALGLGGKGGAPILHSLGGVGFMGKVTNSHMGSLGYDGGLGRIGVLASGLGPGVLGTDTAPGEGEVMGESVVSCVLILGKVGG